MRSFLFLTLACMVIFLIAPQVAAKPPCKGVFTDRDGVTHSWSVNDAHTLIWDGKPYLPVGGMYCPPYTWEQSDSGWNLTKAQIDLLKEKGVIDLYIHFAMSCPPECLQRMIDYLEEKEFRYGIELTDGPGSGPGYAVQREGMKVEEITASGTYGVEIGDAIGGIYLLTDQLTGRVIATGKARTYEREEPTGKTLEDGKIETAKKKGLEADVECPNGSKLCLYFTPEVRAGQPYFWNGEFEKYRDKLLNHFSKIRFGKGFRFVVDPLWNEMNVSHTFLPSSPQHARKFADWLSSRYEGIDKLNKAWSMAQESLLPDFDTAARLVPLRVVKSTTGPAQSGVLYDPKDGKTYIEDAATSQVWYDMMDFSGEIVSRYCNLTCRIFKTKIADVPIVFKHANPIARYRINLDQTGFDGIGMEPYGVGETLVPMNAGVCYSEVEQSARNMWLLVTEFSQAAFDNQLENIGHMDRESMHADMAALLGAGAKGIFVFGLAFGPGPDGQFWMTQYTRDPRQLEWMSTFRRIMENSPRLVDYRPTYYYRYPAQRTEKSAFGPLQSDFAGIDGDWTGLTGGGGRAIMRGPDGTWVLPTWDPSVETPMLMANLNDSPASLRYGPALEKVITDGRSIVVYTGFRRDLGAVPTVDRYFTDEYAKDADGKMVQILKPARTSRVLARTPEGDAWNLVDGKLQVISKQVEDREGWQPDGLSIPEVDQIHEPERFLAEVLGVREFRLDPDIRGFSFTDEDGLVSYLWSERMASSIRLSPTDAKGTKAVYADGESAGSQAEDGSLFLRVPLKKQPDIVTSDVAHVRGRHYPTEKWQDALVVHGMSPEELAGSGRVLPVYGTPDISPGVWIEGEGFQDSNFNLGKFSGMTMLSGGAFWGLDTFVAPSPETGYYARYVLTAPESGDCDLWVREWIGKSPCHWRLNGGKWIYAPADAEGFDKTFCGPWSCFDDPKLVFAWHNYGSARLRAGQNMLEIRVIAKREKGDKYSKFLDALAFTSAGMKPWAWSE